MIRIREAVIVEGRYDKNTLSQVVDGTVVDVGGFGIFKDEAKLALIRRLAEGPGIVIFTDSDSAGFLIRGHLKGAVARGRVLHAYIPDVYGRERRKRADSAEGKLGVEGMPPQVILEALRRAGATLEGEETLPENTRAITKADLFELGLSGGSGSAARRQALLKRLALPERMPVNSLLDVLNSLYSREQLNTILEEIV